MTKPTYSANQSRKQLQETLDEVTNEVQYLTDVIHVIDVNTAHAWILPILEILDLT